MWQFFQNISGLIVSWNKSMALWTIFEGKKKFYLPNNLIFCSKMPLLGFALLLCFLQWRTKHCYFLKTSAAPYWITWIPHPTPMPCLSVLAQTWKNIFFWSNNLHEWYFKPRLADKEKEQSVSMLWEQLHGFGVCFCTTCTVNILPYSSYSSKFSMVDCSFFGLFCVLYSEPQKCSIILLKTN